MIDRKSHLMQSILIETNIPAPTSKQNERESLPKLPLAQMHPGQSFLLETENEDHTRRKLSAVRSTIRRFTKIDNPDSNFRVFRWTDEESGRQGVRVFCVSTNETD